MKLFLLVFIFVSSLLSNDILIDEKYFVDKTNSLKIENIIKNEGIFSTINKYNLGATKNKVWIKLTLYNTMESQLKKRIYNKTSGIDLIDVYIINNNEIVKTYKLGDFREHNQRDNHFRASYFDLQFHAKQKIEVLIQQKTYSPMDIKWQIDSVENFNAYYGTQGMIYFYFFGFFSLTALISLTLFFLLKNKSYAMYTFFTIASIIYQFTIAGFLYQFGIPIYLNTIFGFSIPEVAIILLGLFPIYFFNIKKDEFKYTKFIIKALVFCLAFIALIQMFYPFYYDVLLSTRFNGVFSFLLMLTLLLFSIRLLLLKKDGALFYFLSNGIFFFFVSIYILVFFGFIKYENFFYYSFAIGTAGQDLFLGLALIHSSYIIRNEHEKNSELLNEYSKLTFIGQTMINISHQWKSPINNIYNCINYIEVAREFKDKDIDKIIDKNLKNIKDTTLYLKDTALHQLDFYKNKEDIEEINLYSEIQNVLNLIESEFSKEFIKINFQCEKILKIKLKKNYFLNILMILFENSFKVFKQRKIKKPSIKIFVIKASNKIEINFEDNAGGIGKHCEFCIFDKNYSLNKSTGVGLYLAKEIVTYKFNGTIISQNTKDGLLFKISIPLS